MSLRRGLKINKASKFDIQKLKNYKINLSTTKCSPAEEALWLRRIQVAKVSIEDDRKEESR